MAVRGYELIVGYTKRIMENQTVRKTTNGQVTFFCPGCNEMHAVPVEGANAWGFNDDLSKPTLTPSILVRWPAYPDAKEEFIEWRTERRCHSFITDGMMQFLDDCTHDLKGKTVVLPIVK